MAEHAFAAGSVSGVRHSQGRDRPRLLARLRISARGKCTNGRPIHVTRGTRITDVSSVRGTDGMLPSRGTSSRLITTAAGASATHTHSVVCHLDEAEMAWRGAFHIMSRFARVRPTGAPSLNRSPRRASSARSALSSHATRWWLRANVRPVACGPVPRSPGHLDHRWRSDGPSNSTPSSASVCAEPTCSTTATMGMGAGALAVIGGTVAIVGFLTVATGAVIAVQGYNQFASIGGEALTAGYSDRHLTQSSATWALWRLGTVLGGAGSRSSSPWPRRSSVSRPTSTSSSPSGAPRQR